MRAVWSAGVVLALGCALAGCGDDEDDDAGRNARSVTGDPQALFDGDDVDPCTLLNRQEQFDVGGISLTEPVAPSTGFEAACSYEHTTPAPSWALVISVDPDSVRARPSDADLEGLRGEAGPDGCVVRVPKLGLQVRYQSTDPVAETQACSTAVLATELAGETMLRRLPRAGAQLGGS